MNQKKAILTVAGRWEHNVAASGIADRLTPHEPNLARVMFYAGFASMLEANMEIADLPARQAMQALTALSMEVEQVEAVLAKQLAGNQGH